ncbi:OmpA family protein [Paracoccus sp. (in: a-proteobacteria)]|uniref:OmpA family protein n=1 Tax=Paracoccus sp. TaxID=267 RepID=UPI0035AFF100
MRRIYKTTTAIVTCMALAAPQFALAQDQQDGETAEQQILPTGENPEAQAAEEVTEEATEQAAEQAAEEAPEQMPEQMPEQEPAEAANAADAEVMPAPAEEPAAEAAEARPAAEASEMPDAAEAMTPPDQPQPEAQTQEAAPAAAEAAPPAEAEAMTEAQSEPSLMEPETPVTPAPEPQPEAIAPASKPPVTQAEQPVEKPPVTQAESPAAKPADAAESAERTEDLAREAQKTPEPKPASPEAATAADPAPQGKPGAEAAPATATSEPIGADALREKLEAEAAAQGAEPAPEQAATATPQPATPAADPSAADPQTAEAPAELPAPELQAAPNAVAQRAAEQAAPATAAALSAGSDQAQGQLDEVAITSENTRSSAEDFATSVMQGLQPGTATAQAKSKDDDDDSKRDIAKLLLAGAAGFAVGKMLSNDREVALNTGDRVVVTLPDGSQQVIKDDNALLYRPGSNVQTETFQDGSTRTTVLRADGSRVVTIRDADMNTLRRTLIRADGSETQLIDDTTAEPVRVSTLPAPPPVEVIRRPLDEAALREALRRETSVDRRFSLGQVRDIPEVRALVAPVNVPEVTFDTGSAAITPDQAQQLATLGKVIRDSIDQNPREIYMIEGYTDAIGSNAANLALSDRRAESVALALTEYFQVPPENMVVQGYGEQFLLVPTEEAERQNRRVAVRRITGLLAAN